MLHFSCFSISLQRKNKILFRTGNCAALALGEHACGSVAPFLLLFFQWAEATYTDYVTLRSTYGQGNYYEGVQQQGYTNKGFLFGDWIGREAKGGQVWLTYHLSADDYVQVEVLRKKNAKDFIPGGTTQSQLKIEASKRFRHELQTNVCVQYERWLAPIYRPGLQDDITATFQLTWYPKLRSHGGPSQ